MKKCSFPRTDPILSINWGSTCGDFVEDLKNYMDANSTIRFDGCHTGCTGPIFGDPNNLAKSVSEKLPGRVSGFKGFGLGNAAKIPFTKIGDNNPTSSIGDRIYYRGGKKSKYEF